MLDRDPLALDADEMRRIGHLTVDLLVDRWLADGPAVVRATADELYARIAGDPPEEAEGFDATLERLAADVLPYAMRNDHRGFLGFIAQRRLGRQSHGDRVRAGEQGWDDERRSRRLCERPVPLVDPASGACARIPPRPAPGRPDGCDLQDESGHGRSTHRAGSRPRSATAPRRGERGRNQHGRDRPASGAGRRLCGK